MYAELETFFIHRHSKVAMCKWQSVVDDVDEADLQKLRASVDATSTKKQQIFETIFQENILYIVPDKGAGALKILHGGKQVTQLVIKKHADGGKAAQELLIGLAEDIAAGQVEI